MNEVTRFVEEKFGREAAHKLKQVRTGGDNNEKGVAYEAHFAVAKICEICV